MAKKYVYSVKTGSFIARDSKYTFYDTEMFSSKKKALDRCQNGLDCNKAYDVERVDIKYTPRDMMIKQIDFKCTDTTGQHEMVQRYWIEQIELN
jgi:hypothetical protein